VRTGLRRTDANLLAATRAGESEAFGEFFRRHREAVLVYTRRRATDAEMAADLTAETFASALLSIHRGNAGQVTNGAAWLIGIARHKLMDTYRAGAAQDAARQELGLPAIDAEDADLARIDELAGCTEQLTVALSQLSDAERHAVIERIAREREYGELAREASQPEFAIRKRVSRGLKRLRHAMGVED
jgi:RNA polymerase sigma factor (sigma-70 family)